MVASIPIVLLPKSKFWSSSLSFVSNNEKEIKGARHKEGCNLGSIISHAKQKRIREASTKEE